jgi:polyhydroxyalkanoate synthesis regulator phasin
MEQPTTGGPEGGDKSSQELFKELWSQALVAVGGAEDEVKKLLERLSEVVELKPDDLQRYGKELSERLRSQRKELERSVEDGIRKALGHLKIPSREEVDALRQKLDEVAARIDRLGSRKPTGGKPQ